LFATDEPASIEGINATTVLVRRVKQGVAEWYRLQLREKIWKGLIKTRLVIDPQRGPIVTLIFTWRTVHKLAVPQWR
jgi:site-specific DNA recombinase